ncbi:hypothetical protein [Arachnia propionica]|uniref:Uncharacterized protein n=1 Tax=Arachnia propionica TaxID=1750 RepID=A0A3P1WSE6_9ACTN|nr:hypothetical protein [Arachnia propionica]RRD47383.1 hypothetical protein EII35_14985 [Arachnia propionica]
MVDFGEVYMSVFEHNKRIAEKRNLEREKEALRILDEANGTLEGLLAELSDSPFTGAPDSPASGGPRRSGGPSHTPSTGGGPSSRTPGEPRCGTNPSPNPGAPAQTTRPTSPGMWNTPPGGAPGRDEKDKKRPLIGYQVTRINDDPPTVDPSHFAAGDTTTLTPAPPPEDDRW